MSDSLLDIFRFGFMQRALIAGLVIATVCGILGVFVVLRRTAPLGDALAHVSFGGVAIGIAPGFPPIGVGVLGPAPGGLGLRFLHEPPPPRELSPPRLTAGGGLRRCPR